jgi:hypothetical protein
MIMFENSNLFINKSINNEGENDRKFICLIEWTENN